MVCQHPEKLFIFRMTHIRNIPFIAANGLWSKLSEVLDPDYTPIGNPSIIDRRTSKQVIASPPGGMLGEYIPFYFSGHSPMLLNIATGYGVPKVSQRDIVFIVCDAVEIAMAGIPFCFTDGNAAHSITQFYNSFISLDKLDWSTIRSTVWHNTDEDFDRVRKKMAEFLVKDHIPANMIKGIIVRDKTSHDKVCSMIESLISTCPVKVDTNNDYYYQQYD